MGFGLTHSAPYGVVTSCDCCGTYFYYNRAAIGLACAQATAMRIDIAPHKRPLKKFPHHTPDPHLFQATMAIPFTGLFIDASCKFTV
jgi:hypothetical protein